MAQARLTGLFADRYLIERELGHGASAVVYLAHDKKHDRQIALKVLSKDLAHALGPQRFLQEIHLTSRLHHPHILAIFDSGDWNGLLYYVLPFVRGESLRDRIDREKQLPIEECVRITCEVADALAHAHAEGVIHRDVKPENVLLSDGHALLSDFGIARALDVHTGERLTSSGLIVGTSAYMSPEQASGEENVDARSDIYSLACVLYEMVAGVQPFIGPTTQAVIAQRFTHLPRPVSTYRPAVPEHVEAVLSKALAIAPADRFQTVREFSDQLSGAPSIVSGDRSNSPIRRMIHGRQKTFGFAAAALVVLSAAFVIANPPGHWRSFFGGGAALDSTKYAVIPLLATPAPKQSDLAAADGVYRAFDHWRGLSVVDPGMMSQRSATTLPNALDLAKSYRAGRLVIPGPIPEGKGLFTVSLYDVRSALKLRVIDVNVDPHGTNPDFDPLYASVAQSLLRLNDLPARAEGGEGKTNSLLAWQAYQRGHIALSHWDVTTAKSDFHTALSIDPAFAPARLWGAILGEWTTQADSATWKDDAIRSSLAGAGLSARDAGLAAALAALARHDFPAACAQYRALASSDSVDFVARYGLGECQAMDDKVLPSASSPSGWRFRSSYKNAIEEYLKAFKLDPGAYTLLDYHKLQLLVPIKSSAIRQGHPSGPNSPLFLAWPALEHDTLAFTPYPSSVFAALPARAIQTHIPAVERNLETLVALSTEWARSLPLSADAEEGLADALEARGDVSRPGTGFRSASEAVAKALMLTSIPAQRLRLTATEVRLRIKRREFAGARKLADSLLAADRTTDSSSAEQLLTVAAATGRIAMTGRKLLAAGEVDAKVGETRVPEQVREAGAALLAHAALGDCGPATSALLKQLDDRLQTFVSEAERAPVRSALLMRSSILLAPCTGARSSLQINQPSDRLVRMQQALARNDARSVRQMFDTLAIVRRSERPGDLSLDYTYQEAWLRLAIGDTTAAIQQLDHALEAVSTLASLREFAGAAALGRAMALRAEIANATGDKSTARKYGAAVADLWANADPELQPLVNRMRRLAATPGSS